ncbi:hypothetical protein JCGZ_04379 [Jatropha curcas]|uniref:Inositol polyphosphate-related phosphatase domain-containing protein n=1 Tax=Jatropha curcas TaxID=180498 RepID=A0A067L2X0_JATCU|nr:hypothetical protein JCGZ_04379 [Jatropha curcas]
MGNCNATLPAAKRRSQFLREQMEFRTHEGIKSVKVNSLCDFSRNSDICICLVTWNMNGKVCKRYLERILHDCCKQFFWIPIELKVDKHSVGGLGGLIRRTKGAVAIYINYKGIRMVFISCHLSAHARNVEERNSQFRLITHNLFSKDWNPYARPAQITIWMGDLNYRIQGIDTYPVRRLIQKDLLTPLTSKDQLLQEAERGQIFNGFYEGILTFKPTYKYNLGSSDYDTSHKVRVPSWTDRILFKIEDVDKIDASLHCYESVDSIHSSDHKPVKAHLCLKVREQEASVHGNPVI